jgi:hypothetical protein
MKLFELIAKKYSPDPRNYEVMKIVSYISRYCKPWLQQSAGRVAWRGIRYYHEHKHRGINAPSVFVRQTRTDRNPKDSSNAFHNLYNILINVAGGTANRSNSLFVSGSTQEASYYGKVYAVFPIGSFNYTWSPELADWYSQVEEDNEIYYFINLLKPDVQKLIKERDRATGYELADGEILGMKELFDANSYDPALVRQFIAVNQGLDTALDEGHEIMVSCKNAIYIEKDYYSDLVHTPLHNYWKENIWNTL